MKRTLAVLALISLATTALAGGRYDGIYAHPLSNASWMSVHHDDTRMVAAAFASLVQMDVRTPITLPIGATYPPIINTWDLLGGPLSGNVATVSGEVLFGACHATFKLVFGPDSFQLFPLSVTQTAQGRRDNFPCQNATQGVNWPLTYPRIF